MSALHGRLMAARLEVEASTARAEELSRQVAQHSETSTQREAKLEEAYVTAFNNHCLLAKLLLKTKSRFSNVIVTELYDELRAKEVPISEWPNWIMMRMSGGEPLSAWL